MDDAFKKDIGQLQETEDVTPELAERGIVHGGEAGYRATQAVLHEFFGAAVLHEFSGFCLPAQAVLVLPGGGGPPSFLAWAVEAIAAGNLLLIKVRNGVHIVSPCPGVSAVWPTPQVQGVHGYPTVNAFYAGKRVVFTLPKACGGSARATSAGGGLRGCPRAGVAHFSLTIAASCFAGLRTTCSVVSSTRPGPALHFPCCVPRSRLDGARRSGLVFCHLGVG